MSGFRSHSEEKINNALKTGQEVWYLDTGSDGEDDHLIGEYSEVMQDILNHYEIERLPSHWSIERVEQ